MRTEKNFFHDRLVLLLVSMNTFLTLLGSLMIFLRIDTGRSGGYIIQYRANLGISDFKIGKLLDILSLIVFMVMTLIINIILSRSVYHLQRTISVFILSLAFLLVIISILVSNALLV